MESVCLFLFQSSVSAKTIREALDENLWIYAPEETKNNVFASAKSDVYREMYQYRHSYYQEYAYEHVIIGTRKEKPVDTGVSELVPFSFS